MGTQAKGRGKAYYYPRIRIKKTVKNERKKSTHMILN